MSQEQQIVKKGTEEFKAACKQYLDLFFSSKEEDFVRRGIFEFGEHKGKYLGSTSKKIFQANLPMPFGCRDLFIQPCIEEKKLKGVIWFCDRIGCLCVCCREDFTGEKERYSEACPDRDEMYLDVANFEDEDPEDWEEECW